jgi:hypothetical protein
MKKKYSCLSCNAQIRIGDTIILAVKGPQGERGLLLLSPEIGDYAKTTHPDFKMKKGQSYKIYCPACHATLNDPEKENLVKIGMEDDGVQYDFYFSNIVGEEVTYRINEHKVETFGFHKERYKKYFDLPEEYKKYL